MTDTPSPLPESCPTQTDPPRLGELNAPAPALPIPEAATNVPATLVTPPTITDSLRPARLAWTALRSPQQVPPTGRLHHTGAQGTLFALWLVTTAGAALLPLAIAATVFIVISVWAVVASSALLASRAADSGHSGRALVLRAAAGWFLWLLGTAAGLIKGLHDSLLFMGEGGLTGPVLDWLLTDPQRLIQLCAALSLTGIVVLFSVVISCFSPTQTRTSPSDR